MIVRFERRADVEAIREVTAAAFADAPHADGSEPEIPGRLRDAGALRLSLVAEVDGDVVGHVAFSPATVAGAADWVALGPVSVRPNRQRQGIGMRLIEGGLAQVRRGSRGCVVLGEPAYYARFGFVAAETLHWNDVSAPFLQVLVWGGGVPTGEVTFHPAFGGAADDATGIGAGQVSIEGGCACGAVSVSAPRAWSSVESCACDYCARTGARWGYLDEADVLIEGETVVYRPGMRSAAYYRCAVCGIITHRRIPGDTRVGVNVAGIPLEANASGSLANPQPGKEHDNS